LQGVEIKLPAPYAKAAEAIEPLTLTMPMAGNRKLFASLGERAVCIWCGAMTQPAGRCVAAGAGWQN